MRGLRRVSGALLATGLVTLALCWYASGQMIKRRAAMAGAHPVAFGLPHADVTLVARDGARAHGWLIPAQTLPAKGTVILLHGHSGILKRDVKVAAALHAAGYEVLQMHLRSYGQGNGKALTFGTQERWDVLAALDFLAERGATRVGVVGFSMGGAVALRTAAESERIAVVVTDGVYATLVSALAAWPRERGLAWLEPLFRGAGRAILWLAGRRVGADLTANDPLRWVGRMAPRPLLFMQGEADPFVPMRDFAALWAAAGVGKQQWLAPEAGHRQAQKLFWPDYERHLIAFFDTWLAATPEGSARVGQTSPQTGSMGR